jgi:hypothetical protein
MCHADGLCFSGFCDCRKISSLRGALRSGYNPRKKTARFSTSPSGVIFESGQSFLGHNLTGSEHFRKPNTLCKFSGFVF